MADEVQFRIDEKQHGAFYIMDGNEQIAEMEFGIKDSDMTVYHTEVLPKAEGKGYAKKLLETMVAYVREHNMKVIPLCPYVHAQFMRHMDLYKDIWKKDSH